MTYKLLILKGKVLLKYIIFPKKHSFINICSFGVTDKISIPITRIVDLYHRSIT